MASAAGRAGTDGVEEVGALAGVDVICCGDIGGADGVEDKAAAVPARSQGFGGDGISVVEGDLHDKFMCRDRCVIWTGARQCP